jgi:hypothetical protein
MATKQYADHSDRPVSEMVGCAVEKSALVLEKEKRQE